MKYLATIDIASYFLRTSAVRPGEMWHSTHAIWLCFDFFHDWEYGFIRWQLPQNCGVDDTCTNASSPMNPKPMTNSMPATNARGTCSPRPVTRASADPGPKPGSGDI